MVGDSDETKNGAISDKKPEFAEDNDIDQEVPVERANTLQRVRQDYDRPWVGAIAEALQNGGDAYGTHLETGILSEDAELNIEIAIDTNEETYTYTDNAGGMTNAVLEKNLVGIDTPDESKQSGDKAGAYGRGFYVVAMCGTGKTYVETRQEDQHNALTITPEGKYSRSKTPEESQAQLPNGVQGTHIHVTDVRETDLEKLSDWEAVEELLIEKFTFLLLRDDVEVTYTIDGESYTPSPPDMEKYRKSSELLHIEKLPQFSAEGSNYHVRDLVVIRSEDMGDDLPWTGVAMLKGDIEGEPFMSVKAYKPQRIPSLRRPAKMIGWCDAREMCPELENNSHTSFRGFESDTGIREELQNLHNEHFKKGRTTEETQELASDITQELNELLADVDDFNSYRSYGTGAEVDQGNEEDEEGPTTESENVDILRCQAGDREFDVGDEIPLKVTVNNPKDPESTKYELYDLEINCSDHNIHTNLPTRQIEIAENESKTFDVDRIRPEKEGIYGFSASIRTRPEVIAFDEEAHEEIDSSRIFIRIGDPDRPASPRNKNDDEEGGDSGDDGHSRAEIVNGVTFFPDNEQDWKALASEDDDGFEVTINTDRPEWQRALAIVDNDELRDEIQTKLGVEWGAEELILTRNVDAISELLEDEMTIDGRRASDVIAEELHERADLLAELEAKIENRHSVEYST